MVYRGSQRRINMSVKRLSVLTVVNFAIASGLSGGAQEPRTTSSRGAREPGGYQSTWVRVSPPAEEFAVLMPGVPKEGKESLPIDGKKVAINYYGLNFDETVYVVLSISRQDISASDFAYILMLNSYNKLIPTSLLDKVEEKEKSVGSTYMRDTSLNGYSGRAYTLRAHNRGGLLNFYITGKNYYAVGALTSRKRTAPVKKFLDSFVLAPPAPASSSTGPAPSLKATEQEKILHLPTVSRTWFVVLKTYSEAEQAKANQKLTAMRRLGYDVRVVNSNDYPNLRKGLLVLIAGPYAKGEAEVTLFKMRRVAPDAYIKSGW